MPPAEGRNLACAGYVSSASSSAKGPRNAHRKTAVSRYPLAHGEGQRIGETDFPGPRGKLRRATPFTDMTFALFRSSIAG